MGCADSVLELQGGHGELVDEALRFAFAATSRSVGEQEADVDRQAVLLGGDELEEHVGHVVGC